MRMTNVSAAILIVAGTALLASSRSAAGAGATADPRHAQARSPSTAPTTLDACTLLTKQEAAAAVGASVERKFSGVVPSGMPGVDVWGCNYDSPTTIGEIKLAVWRFSPAAAQVREAYRTRCAQKEGVPGLGDVSCWYNARHTELQVLKGPTLLIITLSRSGDAAEAIKTVAKNALSRLP